MNTTVRHGLLAAIVLALASLALSACTPTYTLGQLGLQDGGDPRCPSGSTCQPFTVSNCPGVAADVPGVLSIGEPSTGVGQRGTVAFFSGGGGGEWWSAGGTQKVTFLAQLRADGFRTVEVRWVRPWSDASDGERAGTAKLACRPATAISWIHDHLYTQPATEAPTVRGRCGFCVTGNSGGSSQISYSLELYGLENKLDAIFPTSGPPQAAQEKGCLDVPGFTYNTTDNRNTIDGAFGYLHGDGPCVAHGAGFDFHDQWLRNSVETAGTDYDHPDTRVRFIFGAKDTTNSPAHGRTYEQALLDHGSPLVSEVVVADMAHGIGSPDGLAALISAIEG